MMKKILGKICLLSLLSLTLGVFGQVPSYIPTDSLIGYWPMNNNANDVGSNAYHMNNSNVTFTTDRKGASNAAAYFSGNSSSLYTKTYFKEFTGTVNQTYSIWFKNATNHWRYLLDYGNTSGSRFQMLPATRSTTKAITVSGTQGCNTCKSGSAHTWPTGNSLLTGWHHIVIAIDKDSIKTYYDGVNLGTKSHSGFTCNDTAYRIYLASDIVCIPEYPNVYLDDLGIWNRTLTETEIKDIFNSKKSTVVYNDTTRSCEFNSYIGKYVKSTKSLVCDKGSLGTIGFENNGKFISYKRSTGKDSLFVSSSGNDNTGTRSNKSKPFKTITKAINVSKDGDVIYILDGLYKGTGNVNLTLQKKKITLESYNGPGSVRIDGESKNRFVFADNGETNATKLRGLTIMNCVPPSTSRSRSNTNGHGGAIYIGESSGLTIEKCYFFNNKFTIDMGHKEQATSQATNIKSCVFEANSERIITTDKVSFYVDSCIFQNNYTTYQAFSKGHVQNPPGTASFNIFRNNHSNTGSILFTGHGFQVNNCLFYDNKSKNGVVYHGTSWSGSPHIDHCTFYNNCSNKYSSSWYDHIGTTKNSIFDGQSDNMLDHISGNQSKINFRYNNGTGVTGSGNFSGDPKFKDVSSYDFTLTTNSPCIGSDENGKNVGADYSKFPNWMLNFPYVHKDSISGLTNNNVKYSWSTGDTSSFIFYNGNSDTTFTLTVDSSGSKSVYNYVFVNQTTYFTDTITSCGPYTWTDGKTYTSSNNTAKDTFTNAAGCDSIVTLNLMITSQHNQIGSDIDGSVKESFFGRYVILSGDGRTLASLDRSGNLIVYKNTGVTWSQIGFFSLGRPYLVGTMFSLNYDGSIIAFGDPDYTIPSPRNKLGFDHGRIRVYKKINSSWTQLGSDIIGLNHGDRIGASVSLSLDGTNIVSGGFSGNSSKGLARIYKYTNGTWTQQGSDIDGEAAGDRSGSSVSISSDGSIVAIGAPLNDGNGNAAGHVRIYKDSSGTWTQVGLDIDGEKSDDQSGRSISLSSNGNIVAIGAQTNDANGSLQMNYGHVRIFKNISGSWTQVGSDIDGEAAGDQSGRSVSLSSDGSVVAIGGDGNDGNGNGAGHVRIYKDSSGTWTQIGSDIDGEAAGDDSGCSVSISSDGSIVAIGAQANDGNGIAAGHVRVYRIAQNKTYSADTITSCGPYTWTNGVTYTSSNKTAKDTFLNLAGCDSIVTLQLQIIDNDILPDDTTLCDNRSMTLGEENTSFDTTGYIDAGSFNGYHYYFDRTLRSWTAARSRAINAGSDLAFIKDSSENAYIQSQINAVLPNTFQYIHLGLIQDTSAANYAEPAGGWYWLNGDSLTFKNWASSEPSNSAICTGGENFGIMWPTGKWNDVCPSQGGRGLVKVKNKFSSYLWSTGDTIPAITVNPDSSQRYWVEVSNGTFSCRDSIYITVLPSSYDTLTLLECDSVISPTGKVYTRTGSYNDTLVNSYGCDSVITSLVTIGDTISPTVLTQNVTLYLNQSGQVSISSSDVNNGSSDNCGITSYRLSDSIFDCTDVGTNTIYLIVTDRYGNIDSASAVITVQDTIKPTVLTQNVTVSLDASGAGSVTVADIDNGSTDNCTIATRTLSKTSFDCSEVGANTIYLVVTDVNGNIDSASAVVTVQDTIKPTVLTQNVTVSLDANGAGSVTVADIDNGSTDNCTIATRTLSKTSFDCSEVGANTIYLVVTDVNGNIDSASAVVTVQDTIKPTLLTQNVTVSLDANGAGSITVADIDNGSTDNCSIASRTLSKTSFDCSNVGANTIYLIVTDVNGNIDSASAVVTVQDIIKPTVLTQNVTVSLDANGAGSITVADIDNGSTDNCSIASRTLSKTSFDCSEVGANTIYLIITDVNGNIDSASAVVTVQDIIKPTVLTQNVTVSLDASGTGSVTLADIDNGSTDNCSIAIRTLSKTSFDCSSVGANTIYLIVTDVNGNIDSASAVVTVQDIIKPTVLTQNVTVSLDANGAGSITVADIDNGSTDNCSIASRTLSKTSFDCSNVGANTIYLIVTDVNGNIDSASAVVTVQDKIKPTVVTTPRDTALGYCNATYTYAIPTGEDNCGVTVTQIAGLPPGSTFPVGQTENTFEISDPSGNTVTTSFMVDVRARYMPFVTSGISICNNNNKIDLSKGLGNIIFIGSGVEANEKSFNPNSLEPGSYSITAEFTDSMGCVSTELFFIEVRSTPIVPRIKRVASDQIVTVRSYKNYQWYRNGEELEGEDKQLLRVHELGIYSVLVGNDENCFEASEGYGFGIPVNEENVTNQGLVKVFPNPTRDMVFVQINDEVEFHLLTLADAVGNKLIEQETSTKVVKLDLTSLAPGTYYLNVLGGTTNENIVIIKN